MGTPTVGWSLLRRATDGECYWFVNGLWGQSFVLLIQVVVAITPHVVVEESSSMTPQPAKPRGLIVDDHPANRRAFETLLETDYTVSVAASGYQALELTLRD